MRRPVGVYRLDGRWHAGLLERRRAPPDAWALRAVLQDLRERLLAQDPASASEQLGHLVQVHDQMRRQGWAGAMALPEGVRAKALLQVQMLARKAPSPALAQFIDRLRASLPAPVSAPPAPARADGAAPEASALEVSEGSSDEFEASQRGWLDTVPPLQPPAPPAKEPSP